MATRLYGLFERQHGTRKWLRLWPELSFPKPTAVRAFQSRLLEPYLDPEHYGNFERSLRPVTIEHLTVGSIRYEHGHKVVGE